MANELIDNLLEALAISPSNIPLRLQVAGILLQQQMYEAAAEQYQTVLQQAYGNTAATAGLAACYYHLKKYSAAIIVYEQLEPTLTTTDVLLYIKCLIKENSLQQASAKYQQLITLNPGLRDEEIDAFLLVPNTVQEDELDISLFDDELDIFMEKPNIKFSDVGGMQHVKDEISIKIIQPLLNPDLFKAFGKKSGGGIMLYGPPGCGKTFIAKATAGEIDAKFICIGLHDILDMWIGNSEKNLHEIFLTARNHQPCVLFFDEVDAIGASRNDVKQSAMRHVINQFLAELDGVDADNEGLLILAATNAPWNVDAAFRRPGRFDRIIFVAPPDEAARVQIITHLLKEKPVDTIDIKKIAAATNEYSGADLNAIIDIAVEEKLRASMLAGKIIPIETKDILTAIKKHKPTTTEWFASARNYALYANEAGQYDDVVKYLKIKK
jgi:transitional endoplasmic reticulum ATPase